MNVVKLFSWFVTYSVGIATLSLGVVGYYKYRVRRQKNLLILLLTFSAVFIPRLLMELFEAGGLLWTMPADQYRFLITGITTVGQGGSFFLIAAFLIHVRGLLGIDYGGKIDRGLYLSALCFCGLFSGDVILFSLFPHPPFGLVSLWTTLILFFLFPGVILYSLLLTAFKKGVSRESRKSVLPRILGAGAILLLFAFLASGLSVSPQESQAFSSMNFFLIPALYALLNGLFLPGLIRISLSHRAEHFRREKLKGLNFSPREGEVVALLIQGSSYRKIAEKLYISLPTVQSHISRIYQKAAVNNKIELIRKLDPPSRPDKAD